ncbi:MAG: hypothetical protein M3P01_09480 [Actinomycetota bacterium]|nr:hypothetical protein [Actinomycetota bacterium]
MKQWIVVGLVVMLIVLATSLAIWGRKPSAPAVSCTPGAELVGGAGSRPSCIPDESGIG